MNMAMASTPMLDNNKPRATIVSLELQQQNGNTQKAQNVRMYFFDEDLTSTSNTMTFSCWEWLQQKLWQILPAITISLSTFSFGLMLGWPSPTYPMLLSPNSPLPISLVQSPMIAGFLMFGTIFTTPISHHKFYTFKYGVMASLILMTIGWLLCWQATNIYHLLISRFTIGMGNGYALGQIKQYISATSTKHFAAILTKMINIITISGVVIAFLLGIHFDYNGFALMAIAITIVLFFLCYLLPHSPQEYFAFGRRDDGRKFAKRFGLKHVEVVDDDDDNNFVHSTPLNIWSLMQHPSGRRGMLLIGFLTFFQQFTGVPATIVYCEMIFTTLALPQPQYIAFGFILIYLVAYIIGTFFFATAKCHNKKLVLIFSCLFVIGALIGQILFDYYDFSWKWKLGCMLIYIIAYGLGLGSVPNTMVAYFFEESEMHMAASQWQLMLFCLFAVIITKLFQVFYANFAMYMVWCLYLGVAIVGVGFVGVFVPGGAEDR